MELFYNQSKEYLSRAITVIPEQVNSFRNSIGSSEDQDEQKPSEFAPLTFPTTFRELEFKFLDDIGLKLNHCLHVDQEYRYHRHLKVGETVRLKTKLARVDQKLPKGDRPAMAFLRFVTQVSPEGGGEPILECITLILVRNLILKESSDQAEGDSAHDE